MEQKLLVQIQKAHQNGYAVPAINVSNMETVYGVMEAASKTNSPVILQIAPSQLECQKIAYADIVELIHIFECKLPDVNYSIHLDHSETVKDCKQALDAGFSSVMFDGSFCNYEDNVTYTKQVRSYAKDAAVEAELGSIGGTENDHEVSDEDANLTDPDVVADFMKKTNVDLLAVSVGNCHGLYKGEPKIHHDLIERITKITTVPLVLHGASGIPEKDVKKAIKNGISKINYYTQIDNAFNKAFVESANEGLTMMECAENARIAVMNESIEIFRFCDALGKGGSDD